MDAVEDNMWWYRALHARVLDMLSDPLWLGARVLDAGCGTGGFLRRLGMMAPSMARAGLEYNAAAAARAALKSGAAVTSGSINALPFAEASFDAVVSLDVLSHRAVDPSLALAELRRVLRPGGMLLLNLPAYAWMRSTHDERVHNDRRFTVSGARRLLRGAGFAEVRGRYWNGLLFPLMALQRKVLARGEMSGSDVQHFAPWLDRSLHAVTQAERAMAHAGLRLPFGGSILLTARRPEHEALPPPSSTSS
ncbi:methyltransferase domain-containing protein [Acetobacteraceae bacterium H6797]|nr:methyltransferase domain-containing protein [Acetobacteraceae bacterium H6797]